MAKRYTKSEQIQDLLKALNEKRKRENKVPIERAWTGVGHWLKTTGKDYKCIGRIFISDDLFIGFLEGLLIEEEKPASKLTDLKKGIIQGICFAVAEALRNSDQAKYALENWSVSLQDAIDAEVPEFDMEVIREYLK